MNHLTITPRDPLVARDGRPFGPGAGNRMRSTGWLTPSVAAGSFRTALAKAAGQPFTEEVQKALLNTSFAGVFPLADGQLLLPAPQDCVFQRREDRSLVVHAARPASLRPGEGGNWPEGGLQPVVLSATEEFKPEKGPAFWPLSAYVGWLLHSRVDPAHGFGQQATADLRDHVSIDPERLAAADGLLFTSAGITAGALLRYGVKEPRGKPFADRHIETKLAARVDNLPAWSRGLNTWHPLGGERRLAHWALDNAHARAWDCPADVRAALADATEVRMTLVTPAVFAGGWRPPAEIDGVRLTLVGACIDRWRAVSGWSYKERGPKPIRRVVPAGGTYFFKVEKGAGARLAEAWLRSVSNGNEQDRLDGFGLAVWGTWKENG